MVTITEDKLQISMIDNCPKERRDWLMLAIAAAIRWNCSAEGKRIDDGENLFVLAELLEQLIDIEKTVE